MVFQKWMPVFAALLLPSALNAGIVRIWKLSEIAAAPVLVVGRIVRVEKGTHVPPGYLPWSQETLSVTADVEVIRTYPPGAMLDKIRVNFLAYGPSMHMSINGWPPPLPQFEVGSIRILPLRASHPWRLIADSGLDLTVPATTTAPGGQPRNAREFLINEIANTFGHGSSADVAKIAGFVTSQGEDLSKEFMPALEASIAGEQRRWVSVAASLAAAFWMPRPKVSDLLAGRLSEAERERHPQFSLVAAVLQRVSAIPGVEGQLIQNWITNAPHHVSGSGACLLEFGSRTETTQQLRAALRNDLEGTSYIASMLVQNGYRSVLPEALQRARRVADRPNAQFEELLAAANLLRDFGSEHDLKELAAIVRRHQFTGDAVYTPLWQSATGNGSPREVYVLAVVLRDQPVTRGEWRSCDAALHVLEKAVNQKFGADAETREERDQAIARALAWLRAHGVPDA